MQSRSDEAHPDQGSAGSGLDRAQPGEGRDLFVSTFSPHLGNGRDLRTYTVIRALAANGPLDLLYVAHGGPPAPEIAADPAITLHEVIPSRRVLRLLTAARVRARGWPWSVARSCSTEVLHTAQRLIAAPDRRRVIVGDLNAMAMLMRTARDRPVIYNAHNVESSYEVNPYLPNGHRWRPLEVLEREVLETASESWMVSRRDMELAHDLAPASKLRYVPNVVDVAAIEPVTPDVEAQTVMMVADYAYPPNLASAHWLVDEVMPRLWTRCPQARLRLTGRGLSLPGADSRVEITGFAPDLREAYAGASAIAVPLVQGAGTPLKFIEALAYGMPVVATSTASRGLAVTPEVDFRLADGPEQFAAQLARLLEEPDPEMGVAARALAEREYSVQTLVRLLGPQAEAPRPAPARQL